MGVAGRVAQLTDTHIVREGATYFGIDTARYLADALTAVEELEPRPDYIVVTGDLANFGQPEEYVRFRSIMAASEVPYFVIPGNHDERETLRATLPAATFAAARGPRVRFTIDAFPIRFIGIDLNLSRPWPGARADAETLRWLDTALAAGDGRPAIVGVHQPPFRTGLHYLDACGFFGARALRRVVDAHPSVCAVISGHIHCARAARFAHALASTSPSTAPQAIPLLFMRGRAVGLERERPGFVVHDVAADGAYTRTEYRECGGSYGSTRNDVAALRPNSSG